MCSTVNILQNPLNSFDVNWVALSETMESATSNLANSSCRNPMTTPVVGFLHLNISDHLENGLQQSNNEQLSGEEKSISRCDHGWSVCVVFFLFFLFIFFFFLNCIGDALAAIAVFA